MCGDTAWVNVTHAQFAELLELQQRVELWGGYARANGGTFEAGAFRPGMVVDIRLEGFRW
jgi:hypothetical protein